MTTPYYADEAVTLYCGDSLEVLRSLPAESVNCVVTSPPYYGLRDYGEPGQYGLEETPAAYVEQMRQVFAEARRVLADDGTLWLNLGDSYARGNTGQGNAGASSKLQVRAVLVRPRSDPGAARDAPPAAPERTQGRRDAEAWPASPGVVHGAARRGGSGRAPARPQPRRRVVDLDPAVHGGALRGHAAGAGRAVRGGRL